MRLLLHDTLVTAPYVLPIVEGWLTADVPAEAVIVPDLTAADIADDTVALIPAAEIAHLQDRFAIVPDVAVVQERDGVVAMRVPVRPDEVERTAVRLYEASGTAEILARATLEPFYGIPAHRWGSEPAGDAQVVIVEGAEALQPPEAGFAEDLVRAWFILTGQPVVSHVLIAPTAASRADIAPAIALLEQARRVGLERRRELRGLVTERAGIDRDRLQPVVAALRFALAEPDRRALLMLLQRGNKGSGYPYVWELAYLDSATSGDV